MILPDLASSAVNRVAVIGMSCRLPGAEDADTFWSNVERAVTSISKLERTALIAEGFLPTTIDSENFVAAKGILPDAMAFDASFFGISPREASLIDPQQRIFLEQVHAGLENAGHGRRCGGSRIGVFGGAAFPTFLPSLLRRSPDFGTSESLLSGMLGTGSDYLTMRAAYKLGLIGPAITVQTACSSSLVAVHLAVQSLLSGDCDIAIAGGATVRSPQISGHMYLEGGALARTGECRPFDASATGLVNGCGVGVIVLRLLDEAVAAGDFVRAVILGSAVNNDGSSKQAFSAPNPRAQEQVIVDALDVAGVFGADIDYVEAHGTGTRIGDAIEIAALDAALAPRSKPCAIGSVKANIGHLDAAAGIAGLIKTILAMERRWLPPQPHFDSPNPDCRFDRVAVQVNRDGRPWPETGSLPLAGVSAFGFGGTNAHVVVQGVEPVVAATETVPQPELYVLQARDPEALASVARRLADALEARPQYALANVAATLRLGRESMACRVAFVDESRAAVRARLLAISAGPPPVTKREVLLDLREISAEQHIFDRSTSEVALKAILHDLAAQIRDLTGVEILQPAGDERARKLQQFAAAVSVGMALQTRGLAIAKVLAGRDLLAAAQVLAGSLSVPAAIAQVLEAGGEAEPAAVVMVDCAGGGVAAADEAGSLAVNFAEYAVIRAGDCLSDAYPSGHALLAAIGSAWAQGADCDWSAFQGARAFQRVPLPTYPFARTIMPDPLALQAAAMPVAGSTDGSAESAGPRLWRADWTAFDPPQTLAATGTFLLVYEDCPLARPLANALARYGAVTQVAAPAFATDHSGPVAEDTIAIYLAAPSAQNGAGAAALSVRHGHAAAQRLGTSVARFDCVGSGIFPVLGGDVDCVGGAGLHALLTVLRLEQRLGPGRTLDADPWAAARGSIVEQARLIAAALASPDSPPIVALRGRSRFERAFVPAASSAQPRYIRPGGVYALIGGAGGVGLALARHLAAIPDVRLAILSRSIDEPSGARLADQIGIAPDRLIAIGLDVAEASSVGRALSDIMREFGSLDGIFHLAGTMISGMQTELDRDLVAQVLDAKTRGMEALLAALPVIDVDSEPRFLALVSSLTGTLGYPGLSLYAAANAAAEAIAATALKGDVRVVAIGLDRVETVGMSDPARGAALVVDLADHAWIARDHRSGGQGYLPGSAVLALLLAAGRQAFALNAVVLEQVLLLRAAPLADHGTARLWVRLRDPDPSGAMLAEVYGDHDGGTRPFAQAQVRAWSHADSARLAADSREPAVNRRNRAVQLPAAMAEVELGPRWQAPTEVWESGEGWVIATCLADEGRADAFPGPIHPALLDIAISAAVGAAGCSGFVPVGYRRVALAPAVQTGQADIAALVSSVSASELASTRASFDVAVANSAGQLLFTIDGYELVSVALPTFGAEPVRRALRPDVLGPPLDAQSAAQALCQAIENNSDDQLWVLSGDLTLAAAAVAGLQQSSPRASAPAASATVLEIVLAAMAEVLGEPAVKPDADFFGLGGDSILALELVANLNARVGWPRALTPQDLYQTPTPAGLAALVQAGGEMAGGDVAAQAPSGRTEIDSELDEAARADVIARFVAANSSGQ